MKSICYLWCLTELIAKASRVDKTPLSSCLLENKREGQGEEAREVRTPKIRGHGFRVIICFVVFSGERVCISTLL